MVATPDPVAGGVLDERRSSPGLLLALLGQHAMRRLRDAHTAQNLSPRQFQLLGLLELEPMAQSELVQQMDIDPSVLVALLNPLELDELILRRRDRADRRRHVVSLTPKGRRHLARAAQAQLDAEQELFAALTEEQLEALRDALVALGDHHLSAQTLRPCSDSAASDQEDPTSCAGQ